LAIVGDKVRAHLVVDAIVAAFVEEVEVVVGEELGAGEGGISAHGAR